MMRLAAPVKPSTRCPCPIEKGGQMTGLCLKLVAIEVTAEFSITATQAIDLK